MRSSMNDAGAEASAGARADAGSKVEPAIGADAPAPSPARTPGMDDATFEQLRDEWRAVMRRFARMEHESPYARAGISPLGAEALISVASLERVGETARPGVVAQRVGTTPSSLSQALRSLEGKGLLERRRLEGDSRGVALALTEAGNRLVSCGCGQRDARLRALFDHLGADDVGELLRIARRMQEFYRAEARSAASRPEGGVEERVARGSWAAFAQSGGRSAERASSATEERGEPCA